MASITICDLPTNQALEAKAMSSIHGGGAPWVFGWITPYDPERGSNRFAPVMNFYNSSNNFRADQMINQFQTVQVNNTGAGANINVAVDERSNNSKH
jgi:hypothetical protein